MEARAFAEGLQQDGAQAVAPLPVVGELALDAGEQVPGQYEEASGIDDEGQAALASGGVPADEAVAGRGFPSGGTKAEQGRREAGGGMDEVAQLRPGQRLVAEVVAALDELVPKAAARIAGAQQREAQRAGPGEGLRQGRAVGRIGVRGRRAGARALVCWRPPAGLRQSSASQTARDSA